MSSKIGRLMIISCERIDFFFTMLFISCITQDPVEIDNSRVRDTLYGYMREIQRLNLNMDRLRLQRSEKLALDIRLQKEVVPKKEMREGKLHPTNRLRSLCLWLATFCVVWRVLVVTVITSGTKKRNLSEHFPQKQREACDIK